MRLWAHFGYVPSCSRMKFKKNYEVHVKFHDYFMLVKITKTSPSLFIDFCRTYELQIVHSFTSVVSYVCPERPPVWSSGQSSWLQIQRFGVDSRRHQIFWKVVGLERGPLSLVSTIEELLERKNSGSGLENRDYGRRDTSRWPRNTLYPQKLALTSPTNGGCLVGKVRSRTEATE
jgi:hypothetical protein